MPAASTLPGRSSTPRIGQTPSGVHPSPSRLSAAAQEPPRPMVQGMAKSPKERRPASASTRTTLIAGARSGPAWWRDSVHYADWRNQKSVVSGKGVSVRVDVGGSRTIQKQNEHQYTTTKTQQDT